MTEEKTKNVDWELVEKHYRAGILSGIQIAKMAGITEGAIRKRVKRDGWVRVAVDIQRRHSSDLAVLTAQDEMTKAGFVYVIFIDTGVERLFKIGMAKRCDARFDQHQCASPFDICVAACYFVGNMRVEENYLHRAFADKRVRGEWFRLTDADLDAIAQRARLV